MRSGPDSSRGVVESRPGPDVVFTNEVYSRAERGSNIGYHVPSRKHYWYEDELRDRQYFNKTPTPRMEPGSLGSVVVLSTTQTTHAPVGTSSSLFSQVFSGQCELTSCGAWVAMVLQVLDVVNSAHEAFYGDCPNTAFTIDHHDTFIPGERTVSDITLHAVIRPVADPGNVSSAAIVTESRPHSSRTTSLS
uniref:Uncharacterized protein n=1 Tax=Timema shepardi TaxID=629360 RepID=A0A7R9FVN8_TIMSH|nr:unnamed protein product [Timema shepardi]